MKKRIVAGLMAGVLMVSGKAFADVDLSGMTYDELVSLHGQVIEAMENSDEVVSFRAEPGEYIVGVDIPAGHYSVRAVDGVDFCVVTVDALSGNWRVNESFRGSDDPAKIIGQLILEDGEKVKIRDGAAIFGAPAGITFN